MLRLVERVFGEGTRREPRSPELATAVAYELDVYRDWVVDGTSLTPGEWVIEGHLLAGPAVLAALTGRGAACTGTRSSGPWFGVRTSRPETLVTYSRGTPPR